MPASAAVKTKAERETLSRKPRESFCPGLWGGSMTSALTERKALNSRESVDSICLGGCAVVRSALDGAPGKARDVFESEDSMDASPVWPSALSPLRSTSTSRKLATPKRGVAQRENLLASLEIRVQCFGEY
jgi:hypothetical protein